MRVFRSNHSTPIPRAGARGFHLVSPPTEGTFFKLLVSQKWVKLALLPFFRFAAGDSRCLFSFFILDYVSLTRLHSGVQDIERLRDPRLVHLALRQGPHELLHRYLLSHNHHAVHVQCDRRRRRGGGGHCRPRLFAAAENVSAAVALTEHDLPVRHGVRRLCREKLRDQAHNL